MRVSKKLAGVRDYVIRKTFSIWEKLGFHVYVNRFDSPIPDTRILKENIWLNPSELVGINLNWEKQFELLSIFRTNFKNEYDNFPKDKTPTNHEYYLNNPNFGSIDAEILYCMIRHFKPKRIFEIGSGFSTFLSAQAILKNKQIHNRYDCELVAIDPFPNQVLSAGFPGLSELKAKRVQEIPYSEFQKMEENDILFIDSSHILTIGSDVHYEYLEIIPRLKKGVLVHIHDIYWPHEYEKEWVLKDHTFYNEQYLLQSFLAFNNSFEVLWTGNYMMFKYPDKLEAAFNSYNKEKSWPHSLWMRRTK